MPSSLALLLFLLVCSLPGSGLVLVLTRADTDWRSDWLTLVVAVTGAGIISGGWLSLVLATLGVFSLGLWSSLMVAAGAVLWQRGWPARRNLLPAKGARTSLLSLPRPLHRLELPAGAELVFLALWFAAGMWLYFRPHEYVLGDADAGIYVNLAAGIAAGGGIVQHDQSISNLDPALYPYLLRALPDSFTADYYVQPAFYVTEPDRGTIMPQFYHFYPALLAVVSGLGGPTAALQLNGVWAILSGLAIYALLRQWVGWELAGAALTGLSICALQVWFARYPVTEMVSQYLFWLSLWAAAWWLDEADGKRVFGWLAGLAFGALLLTRIDAVVLLPVPIVVLGRRLAQPRTAGALRHVRAFALPLGALLVHTLLHAYFVTPVYFNNIFGRQLRLLSGTPLLIAAAIVSAAAVLIVWRGRAPLRKRRARRRAPTAARARRMNWLGSAGAIGLLLLAGYGWFVRPALAAGPGWTFWYSDLPVPDLNAQSFVRLGWYMGPAGVWLGVVGAAWLLARCRPAHRPMLLGGLLFSTLYLWQIQANPLQIYVMRRFVPVTVPFLIGCAILLLSDLLRSRRAVQQWSALVLLGAWLVGLGWSARGFISQVDHEGLIAKLSVVNRQLAPGAILLFAEDGPISQGDVLGTPLRYLFGHEVFTVRDAATLNPDLFQDALQRWQKEGRMIYWVGPWPGWRGVETASFGPAITFTSQTLEFSYQRKPIQLITHEWALELTLLTVDGTPSAAHTKTILGE